MARRPVQCMEKPIVFPHVCLSCGAQSGREYFVDLGLDMDHTNFQPLWEGAIYFCSECMKNLVADYYKALNHYTENLNGTRNSGADNVDQGNTGDADSNPEPIPDSIAGVYGGESESDSPIAATLDSTTFFKLSL